MLLILNPTDCRPKESDRIIPPLPVLRNSANCETLNLMDGEKTFLLLSGV